MRRLFLPILFAYFVLACLYTVATPIFEASDELWHYPFVKYLADHGLTLPVLDPATPTLYRQEGGQPPLYYLMGAALTAGINTSDLETVRHINPHADIGVVVPDGNVNMTVHDPARESFPWHGAVLAVHLVRLLSVALGGVTVVMAYLLARELFPAQPIVALGAAVLTAFNPMFLFISGSVNNDNLSTALASVLLVQIVRLVQRRDAPPLRELALIGIVAGAGMLAKFNIGFLLPLVALALASIAWRLRDPHPLIVGGLVTGGLTLIISAWWYIRNIQLYGDPTGLNVFLRIVGSRPIPANLPQLWSERHTFLMSYWGFFGGVNVPLPDFVYTVFNGIAAISVLGVGLWVISAFLPHPQPLSESGEGRKRGINSPSPFMERGAGGEANRIIGRLFTVIWIVVLFVSLLRWTSVTWASQGRLMFAAIAPLSLWTAVGLWHLGCAVPFIRWRLPAYGAAWFAIIAAIVPLIVARTYDQPPIKDRYPNVRSYDPNRAEVQFCEPTHSANCIRVIAFSFTKDADGYPYPETGTGRFDRTANPGQYITFDLLVTPFLERYTHEWSLFVHFVNEEGLIVAQRDILLNAGQWSTISNNPPAIYWRNHVAVKIPDQVYTPQELTAYLGFYDLKTSERMTLESVLIGGEFNQNGMLIGAVHLLPRQSDLNVPNPANVNFGGEAELVGYDVSTLSMTPGQEVKLTLYWRAQHKMTTDYRAFVHILNTDTTEIYGASDSIPANWTRPTSTWQPGEIIKDEHVFKINDNAPPGTWQIEVGFYELTKDNQFRRLSVITPDGGEAEDYLYLSRVKIGLKRDFF